MRRCFIPLWYMTKKLAGPSLHFLMPKPGLHVPVAGRHLQLVSVLSAERQLNAARASICQSVQEQTVRDAQENPL